MPKIMFKLSAVDYDTKEEIESKFLSCKFTDTLVNDMRSLFAIDAVSQIAEFVTEEIHRSITPRLIEELMRRAAKKGKHMEE